MELLLSYDAINPMLHHCSDTMVIDYIMTVEANGIWYQISHESGYILRE